MQVFKCYFRILNKQKGMIMMYLGIFITMAMLISTQGSDSSKVSFEAVSCKFAVFDEDRSEFSRGLTEYLAGQNERIEVEDDREMIQDEIYNRNIVSAIRIPSGFEEAVKAGGSEKILEISAVPGTIYGELFENELNGYVKLLRSYTAGGFSDEEAVRKTGEALGEPVDVTLTDSKGSGTHSRLYYYFNVLPYIYIAICIACVGTILIVFHKKNVRDRIESSPYPAGRINLELYAGMAITGLGLAAAHLIVLIVCRIPIFSKQGLLFVINEISFLVIPLGIAFLVGKVVTKNNVLSMVSNVVGLGFCFLGGVFVPLQFMNDKMIRAAHFLPTYWYIRACEWVDGFEEGASLCPFWGFVGMELLFGAAFICVGLACSKWRRPPVH